MDIPVFCYHNAVASSLEKDLAFLAENGYRTLAAGEVVDILTGVAAPPVRPAALTFDDGLTSVRDVGLPLLERYDARATLFVITGLVPEGRAAGVDAARSGSESPGQEAPGRGFPPHTEGTRGERLLGWDDLRDLRASGRIEVGSHGHRHNPVHVPADARAGVAAGHAAALGGTGDAGAPQRPGPTVDLGAYARLYDLPVPYTAACDADTIRAVDGTPAHPSLPLFAADTILIDGAAAPARPAIVADLQASRDFLAGRLGIERFHLCLPYGAGCEDMPELARQAGFESIFWSRRPDRDANRAGDDPYRIVRRKHDFVRRLPGTGRRSLLDLLITRVKRRLTSDPWE